MNILFTKWLDALKRETSFSPRWLNTSTKMCPLGVLCDVSSIGTWEKINKSIIDIPFDKPDYPLTYVTNNDQHTDTESLKGTTVLPIEVQELVGFGTSVGTFKIEELSDLIQVLLKSNLKEVPEHLSIADLPNICAPQQIPLVIESILTTNPPSLLVPLRCQSKKKEN